MSPRFLFILYHFPSSWGSASARNWRMTDQIHDRFGFAKVLTASSSPFPVKNNLSTKQISKLDYRGKSTRAQQGGRFRERLKNNILSQSLIRLINTFPLNILAGEGGLYYIVNAVREGSEIIEQEQISHIYSSFRPMSDHVIAWQLKKKFPHLIWIADFRDLPADPHFKQLYAPSWHRFVYTRILRKADFLTTVSEGLGKALNAYHHKLIITRNFISDNYRIPTAEISPYFTIVYTGSMFLDFRNPEPLLSTIHKLINANKIEKESLRIHYAGKDSETWELLVKNYDLFNQFIDHGYISPDNTLQLQQSACLNLLLTTASTQLDGVLTGKMIEYLQAGSPILAIVKGGMDIELQQILKEVSAGLTVTDSVDDERNIEDFILNLYSKWLQSGKNEKPVNFELMKENFSSGRSLQSFFNRITSEVPKE